MPDPPGVTTPPSPVAVAARGVGRALRWCWRFGRAVAAEPGLRSGARTALRWARRLALAAVALAVVAVAAVVLLAWLTVSVIVGLAAAALLAFAIVARMIAAAGGTY